MICLRAMQQNHNLIPTHTPPMLHHPRPPTGTSRGSKASRQAAKPTACRQMRGVFGPPSPPPSGSRVGRAVAGRADRPATGGFLHCSCLLPSPFLFLVFPGVYRIPAMVCRTGWRAKVEGRRPSWEASGFRRGPGPRKALSPARREARLGELQGCDRAEAGDCLVRSETRETTPAKSAGSS
jgi:hypothetical protein